MTLTLVTIPCLADNYAFLLHDTGTGATALVDAPEAFPAKTARTDAEIEEYVRGRCGTAYHPVGTLAMGVGAQPVTPDLRLKQVDGVWVADASVMPQITSANTNAPSMMIGHRAAKFIQAHVSLGR